MAYTESVEYDQITVTNPYSSVGVRKSVIVKKDGVEIARTPERYSLQCGWTEDDGTWIDTDISGEPDEVKSCLLYTSPSPRDATLSRMPSSA